MHERRPFETRQMYTVFTDFFAARAKRFNADKPSTVACLEILHETIGVLLAYEECLTDLIAREVSIARHDASPTKNPLRFNGHRTRK